MAKSNFYAVEIVTTDGPVVSRFFYGLGWHRRNRGRRTPVHDVHDASRRTA
jgi:hypothetical protein